MASYNPFALHKNTNPIAGGHSSEANETELSSYVADHTESKGSDSPSWQTMQGSRCQVLNPEMQEPLAVVCTFLHGFNLLTLKGTHSVFSRAIQHADYLELPLASMALPTCRPRTGDEYHFKDSRLLDLQSPISTAASILTVVQLLGSFNSPVLPDTAFACLPRLVLLELRSIPDLNWIGNDVAEKCPELRKVVLSDLPNLSWIGKNFLGQNRLLREISFSGKALLRKIDAGFCGYCGSLSTVELMDNFFSSVETIGSDFMTNCTSLGKIDLSGFGKKLSTIEPRFFQNCSRLRQLALPVLSRLSTISKSFFAGCSQLPKVQVMASTQQRMESTKSAVVSDGTIDGTCGGWDLVGKVYPRLSRIDQFPFGESKITFISLSDLPNLTRFDPGVSGLGRLCCLNKVTITSCPRLQVIGTLVGFNGATQLHYLILKDLPELTETGPLAQGCSHSLMWISLENLPKLKRIDNLAVSYDAMSPSCTVRIKNLPFTVYRKVTGTNSSDVGFLDKLLSSRTYIIDSAPHLARIRDEGNSALVEESKSAQSTTLPPISSKKTSASRKKSSTLTAPSTQEISGPRLFSSVRPSSTILKF